MSEKKKKTICPSCGAEVPVDESKNLKKICNILRGVLEDDPSNWEDLEEAPLVSEDLTEELQNVSIMPTKTTMTVGDQIKKFVSYKLINRIVITVLAFMLFLLSFAPWISYQIQMDGTLSTYTMAYSGADNIEMTAASAYLLSENARFASSAYNAVSTEILVKQATNLRMGMSFSAIMATIAYVGYLILCVAFFVVAVKDLISEFFATKKNRVRLRRYKSDAILCLLLCMLPVLIFLLSNACELSLNTAMLSHNIGKVIDTNMAWGAVLSFILALLGTIFVCMSHSFGALRLHGRYFDRMRVKHIISVVLVIVLLLSVLMPCIKISMWNSNVAEIQTEAVSLSDVREINRNERRAYQDANVLATEKYQELTSYSRSSENAGEEFINTLFLTSKMSNIRMLYMAIEILTALTLLFAGALLWNLLRRGFFGAKQLKAVNFFKVLTLIAVGVNLILVIVMQQLLTHCLPTELLYSIVFGMGAGMVMMVICALSVVVLRLSAKKEVEYVDEDYDNADVSYAPYVLGKKK